MNCGHITSAKGLCVVVCAMLLLGVPNSHGQVQQVEQPQRAPARPIRPTHPEAVRATSRADEETVSKIIHVQFVSVNELVQILDALVGQCEYAASQNMGVIVVRGSAEQVQKAEEACRELDRPKQKTLPGPAEKNIEIRLHFLEAGEQGGPDAMARSAAIPADLADVTNALKNEFAFADCRLVDTLVVRSRNGEQVEASGFLPSGVEGEPPIAKLQVAKVSVLSAEPEELIRLEGLVIGAEVVFPPKPQIQPGQNAPVMRPTRIQRHDVGLNTDLDVRPGQNVLVGKMSVDGTRRTLFLVIEANIVD